MFRSADSVQLKREPSKFMGEFNLKLQLKATL